jgi:hypothetical protein
MQLEALPATGRIFSGWSDGSTENPRLVEIGDNANYTAVFK